MMGYTSFLVAIFCLMDGASGIDQGLKVTLAIFSGLRDPEWQLQPTNPMFQNITGRLEAARKNRLTYKEEDMEAKLGYKGFLVGFPQQTELIVGPNTLELQKLLLQTMPVDKWLSNTKDLVKAIEQGKAPVKGRKKRVAPPFNLLPWNAADRVEFNNCYNYATNQPTDHFSQPGTHSGNPLPRNFDDEDVKVRAEQDGLVTLLEGEVPPIGGPFVIPPAHQAAGHLVALVVSPQRENGCFSAILQRLFPCIYNTVGPDFHWYRLDADGTWSHKPGETPVTRVDANNQPILDPREAAHGNFPRYRFVCFMTTTANTHVN